jgi:hypothetical protein
MIKIYIILHVKHVTHFVDFPSSLLRLNTYDRNSPVTPYSSVTLYCSVLLFVFCVLYCSLSLYCTVSACDVRAATLTEVLPCFSSVVRQMPEYNSQTRGTARTSQISFKFVDCYVRSNFFYCYACSVLCILCTVCV